MGLAFTADSSQYVCGIRFFKSPNEISGTHSLDLWSSAGTLLASATTSNETVSGWQTALFTSPYLMSSGTTYEVGGHFVASGMQNPTFFREFRLL